MFASLQSVASFLGKFVDKGENEIYGSNSRKMQDGTVISDP